MSERNPELELKYGLIGHPGVSFIAYTDEENWLETRKTGIGGSDAAAVMGLSSYTSPLKVYKIKRNLLKEDLSDNIYIRKGKSLEPLIREQFVRPKLLEMGYSVVHPEHMFVNTSTPWLIANLDGLAIPTPDGKLTMCNDNIVIEIKFVSEYGESKWYGETYCGIPKEYYAQVQHYMHTVHAKRALVCALFESDWQVHYFSVPYDSAFVYRLIDDTHTFYDNMVAGIPPKITPSKDTEEIKERLDAASPTVTYGAVEYEQALAEYFEKQDTAKTAYEEMEKAKDKVLQMHLDGYRSNLHKVSVSIRTRTGFNAKKFAVDYPMLYKQYETSNTYTTSVIKKV